MKTILIVEDRQAEQQIAANLLKQAGFQVSICDSAEEAWTWLLSNLLPDLILLDIVMPGLSGLELCRMIRTHEALASVPIVFCSSKREEFDKFWALRQGGNAYIAKPYAPKDLLEVVKQHLK